MAAPHLGHACSSSAGLWGVGARSQLFGGMEPILLWRSFRTPSGLPKLVGESGDIGMPECGDAVCVSGLRLRVGLLGVLLGLSGVLLCRQVLLFSMLFGDAVGVSGAVV